MYCTCMYVPSNTSRILQYCNSLSPSVHQWFLLLFFLKAPRNTFLQAPLNISLLLQTLFDPTPRRHSIPTSLASILLLCSLLPLAAWWSLSASLYRCTRREMATWMVTEIICKRRSLQTPLLARNVPSVSPTMLAATWSIRFPYRGAQSFPPRGWRVCSCAHRRTLVLVERCKCAYTPRIWKQPTRPR